MTFRATHARFAADLLDDAREAFLKQTAEHDKAFRNFWRMPWSVVTAMSPHVEGNRAKLIEVAAYVQWIGDHIRYEEALSKQTTHSAAVDYLKSHDFPDVTDRLALLEREIVTVSDRPPGDPPAFPDDLANLEDVPLEYVAELVEARELSGQALWAVTRSTTPAMLTLGTHLRGVLDWAQRARPQL